ncbi:UDP-N-acetylmuramoylalanine--D-glutamate ligase [Cerasibacillus quisquiliarum]|uniref:UDP-N-acetylmuramoylalanine--D-glutamate ligase n=1 Tax=Cerasibacillus quisquiliarum TaxID=227865 RepID=A0A511UY18_9BACI|nr:UDP-N-acetylmuramoyl-L-alanine--D-glutamate ligase [Cerasibacillus quisquiliarum]MBB5145772.1 UDP-N-acetylmuramoylalanine--D-glutamate ligase [Cerasibacillus quisquiliarum]GEN30343.1 UDP-N-acetylmuramoylalanine--D-glutamate ligase [Cerasibacillus quisquiliarum]
MNTLSEFPYTDVLVLGLAKSGTAATSILLENGCRVRVNDLKTKENDPIVKELNRLGADIIVGSHPLNVLDGIEVVIKNPGIPYSNSILQEAIKRNIPILTEIELASYLATDRMIGITGSNGKTTTTTLVTNMLLNSKQKVKVAGNIGTVASEVARDLQEDEQLVLELSSFQLLGIDTFRPKIAVLLNIFEAHLDYHLTMKNYIQAKANIIKNQGASDYFIYNADDPVVSQIAEQACAIKVPFSLKKRLTNGAWIDESTVYYKTKKIIEREEIALVGSHNMANILAAISTAIIAGATIDGIKEVLRTFTGVKHRLQYVTEVNGRTFYNDSKATNVLATEKALASFTKPTILLAGGLDRGNDFFDLIPYLKAVKALVLFGETKEKIAHIGKKAGIKNIQFAKNVEDATEIAYNISDVGDVILLSPACASWDQYKTFEQRGDMFIQAVHRLK